MRALGTMLLAAVVLALALAMGASAQAQTRAGEDVRARADVILRQAEAADEAFDFPGALAHYDEGRALDPGSPRAPRVESRAATLRAHAEGDFVPFTKLERVRRDPALSSNAHAVDELVREAESFPPGLVRVEVWVLAAEGYAHRFGRPNDAEGLLLRVIADPATDRVVAHKAARDAVTLQLDRGDTRAAERTVEMAGTRADPQLGRDVRRGIRRGKMHIAAIVALVAMLIFAARAALTASRRGGGVRIRGALRAIWKLALGYAAYVALAGAALAAGYEAGTTKPFLFFGMVLVPLVLFARMWGAAGGESSGARAGRAMLCGAAVLGAAFLVLESVDVAFLEGMGL